MNATRYENIICWVQWFVKLNDFREQEMPLPFNLLFNWIFLTCHICYQLYYHHLPLSSL
jgi:hypothetical protein